MSQVKTITPNQAKTLLAQEEAILIDVREPAEHKSQRIKSATLNPLGKICCADLPMNKKIIIHCQKGMRGANACQKLLQENADLEIYNLEGGIEAWQQAGLPVVTSENGVLSLDRQVQLTIGLCLVIASALGLIFSPLWFIFTAAIGMGLTIAGITGFCGLARIMARMPWNQT